MGTSKGYKMPSGGDWGPLKREATEYAQNIGFKPVSPQSLLRHYIRVRNKADERAVAGGIGAGPGGGSGGGGRASRWATGAATARNIGDFLSRVGQIGLAGALHQLGLGDLVGRSATEVSAALLDKLSGPASTLDQAAARHALIELNDELLAEAESFQDAEQALMTTLDQQGLLDILTRFFGYYLYECFCGDFYERLLKKVGSSQVAKTLKSIKDCIESAIRAKLAGRDARGMDWRGAEGKRVCDQVLGEVLDIFEVPA